MINTDEKLELLRKEKDLLEAQIDVYLEDWENASDETKEDIEQATETFDILAALRTQINNLIKELNDSLNELDIEEGEEWKKTE